LVISESLRLKILLKDGFRHTQKLVMNLEIKIKKTQIAIFVHIATRAGCALEGRYGWVAMALHRGRKNHIYEFEKKWEKKAKLAQVLAEAPNYAHHLAACPNLMTDIQS
jgi:hypothetical protein